MIPETGSKPQHSSTPSTLAQGDLPPSSPRAGHRVAVALIYAPIFAEGKRKEEAVPAREGAVLHTSYAIYQLYWRGELSNVSCCRLPRFELARRLRVRCGAVRSDAGAARVKRMGGEEARQRRCAVVLCSGGVGGDRRSALGRRLDCGGFMTVVVLWAVEGGMTLLRSCVSRELWGDGGGGGWDGALGGRWVVDGEESGRWEGRVRLGVVVVRWGMRARSWGVGEVGYSLCVCFGVGGVGGGGGGGSGGSGCGPCV